ncbi:hypothetical protein PaecuDRAFT_1852 [Paenibacillus curdlanolyticus YK9]|uniref:Uncharacterized protein n=1 Tax=Paenibacillus curdlanolyticus YK9 TaxID=717606 RepID=E0I8A1_9BACL|nr:hypothetical protein [Paenibacillus curdlanolyticus]EFM11406.1 hypothetical protein PaecuDRAFT_1852 [Paenibacillus curdlanolyticus YK9]
MNINFGKYSVPPTLQHLIDLRRELADSERFYNEFNFYLALDDFRYFSTPSDVVVFGNIGVDGIHYGFLTDYGAEESLETAPIVCVSPMDFDEPSRIAAANLKEFLSVNHTDSALFYNYFASEASYLEAKRRWQAEAAESPYQPTDEEKQDKAEIWDELLRRVELPEVPHPFRYVQQVNEERQKHLTVKTQDGLGVTAPLHEGESHHPFSVDKRNKLDFEQLRHYLIAAPEASKLALFRDIQMNFVLQDEDELCSIIVEAMRAMGLTDEAARIASM